MTMRRVILLAALVAVAAGVGVAFAVSRDGGSSAAGTVPEADGQISSVETAPLPGERGLKVRPGSRRAVGEFRLRGGRTIQLRTLATSDGKSCLVEVEKPSGVAGSSCFDGELFAGQKVVFAINFDGGPERFGDMYLFGVAGPEVARVAVERTDGSSVDVEPNAEGGFLVQSSPQDLELNLLPTSLRLFARGGAPLGVIEIPGPW